MPLFLALRLEHPLSRQQCIIWSTFATFMIQSLWFVVEAVQLIKVRAFYSDYPKCLRCLQIFRIVAFAIATYSSVSVVSYLVYDGACNVVEMPRQASYFASTSLLTQAVILPLMLTAKTVKEDWKHSSLIATTSRDSLLVFAVITAISAMLIAHADDLSHIIPSYLLAGLSVCPSRRRKRNLAPSPHVVPSEMVPAQEWVVAARKRGHYSALTLLLCEYLSTLSGEVNLVWSQRFSSTTLKFFFCRYVPPFCLAFASIVHNVEYDGACHVVSIPSQLGWAGCTFLTNQVVSLLLVLSPKIVRDSWRTSSLIASTSRDSVFAFFALAGSALALVLCEYFCTLESEVNLVWTQPRSLIKYKFLVCRYSSPLCLSTNIAIFHILEASDRALSNHQCIAWASSQTIVILILMCIVESLQAVKVAAFYSDWPKTLAAWRLFRIAILVIMVYAAAVLVQQLGYDEHCHVEVMPQGSGWPGYAFLATQVVFILLLLSPRIVRERWRTSSIIAAAVRDSFLVFIAVSGKSSSFGLADVARNHVAALWPIHLRLSDDYEHALSASRPASPLSATSNAIHFQRAYLFFGGRCIYRKYYVRTGKPISVVRYSIQSDYMTTTTVIFAITAVYLQLFHPSSVSPLLLSFGEGELRGTKLVNNKLLSVSCEDSAGSSETPTLALY
ncbi:hypothetical protein ONZ45_g11484 [Pleurotus djamor]|nr:hypothetical protein ONZ45_g11484 [Pleurotus djamor]